MAAAQGLDSGSLSDADRRELAAVVDGGAARIAGLVDGLLDQQRLDAGAAEPSRAWCALDEVLEAALGDFGLPAATFSVAVGDDVPPVHADPAQLRTSFGNLLANAARYSHGQAVRVDARRAGDRVTVRIADRGPGVPPDARGRVFEAFQRGESDPAGHAGSGLGLAIARAFVEANDGRIAIESTAGGGATFVVQLPRAAPVVEPATLRAAG
jgi:two-component system sensor histidine kinase KdpD